MLLEDVEFALVAGADVPSMSLRVLGSHLYQYTAGRRNDCFLLCAAAIDCAAFVDHKLLGVCAFKRKGGKVITGQRDSDVFVRKQAVVPSSSSSLSMPPPPLVPLTDGDEHRIFLVPNFVSVSEATKLLHLGDTCLKRRRQLNIASPVGDEQRVSVGSAECEASSDDAILLSRIEDRIASLTQMPAHEDEETLLFTNATPVGAAGPWFTNVHHDKNKQERRRATVIVYLSSQTDEAGGHTIFPTLPRSGSAAVRKRSGRFMQRPADRSSNVTWPSVRPWADAVRRAYDADRRAIGCQGGGECVDEDGLIPHVENECMRALSRLEHAVAIRPTLGTALVFWSMLPNGTADKTIWHTACLPREVSSSGRWILQKFKSPAVAGSSSCAAP
mmetsp:Transcript_28484/g.72970  ORF Transcript_28484/g.72970 Transcript_28484/m.72970 type:complete len:387 (+) Transcript_28484:129-1289(+)